MALPNFLVGVRTADVSDPFGAHHLGEVMVYFLYLHEMRFEFDPVKSAANKVKHGIDFVEAQALWLDADRVEQPARSDTEPRVRIIGRIQQTVWAAFVTYRHEETIRIISVRRARPDDKALYNRREVRLR